jgi:GWxTD domain-containing protein
MCFPISSSTEKLFINTQLKVASLENMQKFFLAFWQSRNAVNPSGEWQKYYLQVLAVNEEFKTPSKKGYETERGRVYLQYGPPNTRFREYMDPSAWPYEIWHYYLIGTQSNGKFLFYSRDYAHNDFVILNSNVKGEISNYRWEVDLHTRDTFRDNNPMDLDRTKEAEYFSGKAREQWESTY